MKLRFFSLLVIFAAIVTASTSAFALTVSSTRDCDDNAILRCGALTTDELAIKYESSGMGPVYARFGITGQEVHDMGTTSVLGRVTSSNTVVVAGKVVATDAVTAGRQFIPGSTEESSGGIRFYQRPPSVSFNSASLPAFVVMQNDRFSFAIIASCGNPVKATPSVKLASAPAPAAKPSPQPQPQPPVQPSTTVNITNTNTQSQAQAQAQATSNSEATQPSTASAQATAPSTYAAAQARAAEQPATPVASSATTYSGKSLPNTGPGAAIAVSGFSSVLATFGHIVYKRRRI